MKLNSALRLAEMGFRVFPLQPNGKRPATPDGLHSATLRRDIIESWWGENPHWNIGVATGGNYFVVDADAKDGKQGLASLSLLDALYDLPMSWRVLTPTGGVHVYLAKEPARVLVSNAGKVEGFPDIDIRAEGGYVVGPGSTIDGVAYTDGCCPIEPAPESFFPLLRKPIAERMDIAACELDLPQNVQRAIDYLTRRAPEAIEGAGGNTSTFEAAAELRALGISEWKANDLLLEHWNEQKASPPWMPDELATIVGNAFRYGQGAAGGKTAVGEFEVVEIDELSEERIQTSDSATPKTGLLVRASDFAPQAKPERQFFVKDLIPHKNVTILNGDGGTGKSLLAMQLAVASVTKTRWLGQTVKPGPVLYLSAEDDEDETHIRLKDICDAERLDLSAVRDLHVALLAGENALLAVENSAQSSVLIKTQLFARLRGWLAQIRPGLLVLDNLADIFGANQNVQALARQFVGILRGLAIEFDLSVLLLAHPSLSGIGTGTGSSGSVAWNNSVRSRLYLQREKDKDGGEADPNRRFLEAMKANYAPTGMRVDMHWERGRFVALDIPELVDGVDDAGPAEQENKAERAKRVFRDLVASFNRTKRAMAPTKGVNYAPVLFAGTPMAHGLTARNFEIAMHELFENNEIQVVEFGPPSRRRQNIVLARDENSTPTTPLPPPTTPVVGGSG